MKTNLFLLVSLGMVAPFLPAQSAAPVVKDQGPNHRTWEQVVEQVGMDGKPGWRTNRYVELGNNLHYWREGEWRETRMEIKPVPGGAAVETGPYQAGFWHNLNAAGAIELRTPDGQLLRSHIAGLAYWNPASGKSVMVATVKDSIGKLHPPNLVVYEDAFAGVKADVHYVCTAGKFEQFVVLREAELPDPQKLGIGRNGESVLQVITEFMEVEEPRLDKTRAINTPAGRLADESLVFGGGMRMAKGQAFRMGGEPEEGISVSKSWVKQGQRQFLIESVALQPVVAELERIKAGQPQAGVKREGQLLQAKTDRDSLLPVKAPKELTMTLPPRPPARKEAQPMLLAQAPPAKDGFVIDYALVSSATNFTFQCGTTYYVGEEVLLSGTTVLEGGLTVKFAPGGSLRVLGSLDCQTKPYLPAVFTGKDDNSIGESITGSTGNPFTNTYATVALSLEGSPVELHDLRIAHAQEAIRWDTDPGTNYLSHAQLIRCQTALRLQEQPFTLRNVLITEAQTVFTNSGAAVTGSCEQVTVDVADWFNAGTNLTLNVTNTLLVAVTNLGTFAGSHNATNSSGANVFVEVGVGGHYLATNSSCRDAGTTNINPQLLGELRSLTTWPPTVLTNVYYSNDLTLDLQAARDTNTPDIGYHYLPLDWAVYAVWITNATLTVSPGTVVTPFEGYYGIWLQENSTVASLGTPQQPVRYPRYFAVQEQSRLWGTNGPFSGLLFTPHNLTNHPSVRFDFSEFYSFHGYHFYQFDLWTYREAAFRNCAFYGLGGFDWYQPSNSVCTLSLSNVLFYRASAFFIGDVDFSINNALFKGGTLWMFTSENAQGTIRDTVFDGTDVQDYSMTNFTYSHNAFIGMTNRLMPTNVTDIVLDSFPWLKGPLGDYYHGTNLLVNAGSRTADAAGLYHFTTGTNQVKETNSTVDLGFHYVAVGADGLPLDSDLDGTPDFLEDANGNGQWDAGETGFTDFYNGTLPQLSMVSGNGQTGYPSNWLAQPLVVQVRDAGSNALVNAPLTFALTAGGGGLALSTNSATNSTVALLTDAQGQAAVYLKLPNNYGTTNQVTVTAQSGTNSTSATFTEYSIEKVATPTASPGGGNYAQVQTVTVSCATGDAWIFYTLDGTEPTMGSYYIASETSLALWRSATLKLRAFKGGCEPSDVLTGDYLITGGLAAGGNHSLGLKSDGTVWTWGNNNNGQLGNGTNVNQATPAMMANFSNLVAVAGGYVHSVALTATGTVYAWGDNASGKLGDNTTTDRWTPVKTTNLSGVVAIAAGYNHNLALTATGTVSAWGDNAYGKLGDGTTTDRKAPITVTNLSNVVAISAGEHHSLALKADGTVWGWGYNVYGQVGDNTEINRYTPVQVVNLSNVTAIAAGGNHSLALTATGTVYAWGYNQYGRLGTGATTPTEIHSAVKVTNLTGVVAIAGGDAHSLALKSDGTVWAWGYNDNGRLGDGTMTTRSSPVQVSSLSNAVAIAAGEQHSLAMKADGSVMSWGYNDCGQLGSGFFDYRSTPGQAGSLVGSLALGAGGNHSLLGLSNTLAWAWGLNSYGQLGNGTNVNSASPVQISGLTNVLQVEGGGVHSLARLDNGTVRSWGNNGAGRLGDGSTTARWTPVTVTNLSNVISVAAGDAHNLAVKEDETVWAWGENSYGRLGDGTATDRYTPVPVNNVTGAVGVAAGYAHSLAVMSTGTVYAWGYNSNGQLGDNTTVNRTNPVVVTNLSGAVAVAAGYAHSLALMSTGTVYAWGDNANSQLGDNTTTDRRSPAKTTNLNDVAAIAAGKYHNLALKSNGTVYAWGDNTYGQLGDGTLGTDRKIPVPVLNLSNVMAIAAGDNHSLAVLSNGTVWAWGDSQYGQLGDGNYGFNLTPVQAQALYLLNWDDADGDGVVSWQEWQDGTNPGLADSDYDGASDGQEKTDGTNPLDSGSVSNRMLGHWKFDTEELVGEQGQQPLYITGVNMVSSWSNNAVNVPGGVWKGFDYRDVETNGLANINFRNGTVRFWFKPNWSGTNAGGQGPQTWPRLLQTGSYSYPPTIGWWALGFNPEGTQLWFSSHTNRTAETHFLANISWASTNWYQVVLTYTPTNSVLYVNGQAVTNGTGVTAYPEAGTRAIWALGLDGSTAPDGAYEELQTYNYPLRAAEIAENYLNTTIAQERDDDGDGLTNEEEIFLGTNPFHFDTDADGLPDGWEIALGLDPLDDDTGDTGMKDGEKDLDEDLLSNQTEIFFTVTDPADAHTMSLACDDGVATTAGFLDSGGDTLLSLSNVQHNSSSITLRLNGTTNGVRYEIYTKELIPVHWVLETNFLGQAGQTSTDFTVFYNGRSSLFFIAGLGDDRDGDGLSDCYEALFSRSRIDHPDSDGDGLPDGWEWRNFGNFTNTASGDNDQDGRSNGEEYQAGSDPWDYFNGVLPTLSMVSGDQQTGIAGWVLSLPLDARLTDSSAQPLSNAPLTFVAGSGLLLGTNPLACTSTNLVIRADSNGLARAYARMPWTPGTNYPIQAWAFSGTNSASATFYATVPASQITVTNPVGTNLARPLAQLQGLVPFEIAEATYDLVNANGLWTNQPLHLIGRQYDTNALQVSGAAFQGYDLRLAPGANDVIVRIKDPAGVVHGWHGVWQLNTNAANDLASEILWPPSGATLAGRGFTLRGQTADPSARVTVTPAGTTNVVIAGVVERHGTFWVDDLPLAEGENQFTLTITDAGGRSTNMTFSVTKAPVEVRFEDVPSTALGSAQNAIPVTFWVTAADYLVYVNGVGTIDPSTANCQRTLEQVPIAGEDYVTLHVRAIPASATWTTTDVYGNPEADGAADMEITFDRPPEIVVSQMTYFNQNIRTDSGGTNRVTWRMNWDLNATNLALYEQWYSASPDYTNASCAQWPGNAPGSAIQYPHGDDPWQIQEPTNITVAVPPLPWLHAAVERNWEETDIGRTNSLSQKSQTYVELRTHGRAIPDAQSLIRITGTATQVAAGDTNHPSFWWEEYFNSPTLWFQADLMARETEPYWPLFYLAEFNGYEATLTPIAPTNIFLPSRLGMGRPLSLADDLFVKLPNGARTGVTPSVASTPEIPADYYTFNLQAWRADADLDNDSLNLEQADGSATTLGSAARAYTADLVEDLQGDPAHPGKILFVNNGDTDHDGLPNFADGFAENGQAETNAGGAFMAVAMELPSYQIGYDTWCHFDLTNARIRLQYSASAPNAVYYTSNETDGVVWHPAPGALRLWKKNGLAARNSSAVASGGDYVPPGVSYTPSELGFNPQNPGGLYSITLFVESTAVSATCGDQSVTLEVDPDGDGPHDWVAADRVRFSSLDLKLAEAADESSANEVKDFKDSHPSPVFTNIVAAMSNVGPNEDGTRLLADLFISGTVQTAICDLLPGTNGVITNVHIYVNGVEVTLDTNGTPLTISKGTNLASFTKPYPFSGTFSNTFQGVEVDTGTNVIRVIATDPAMGITGYIELTNEITAMEWHVAVRDPRPIVPIAYQNIRAILDFGTNISSAADLATNSVTLTMEILTNAMANPGTWVYNPSFSGALYAATNTLTNSVIMLTNANAWVVIEDASQLNDHLRGGVQGDGLLVSISVPALAPPNLAFALKETGQATSYFVHDHVAMALAFTNALDTNAADTVTAILQRPGYTPVTNTLTETDTNSLVFVSGDATFSVGLTQIPGFSTNDFDYLELAVTNTTVQLPHYELALFETDTNSLIFATYDELQDFPDDTTFGFYLGCDYSAGSCAVAEASEGGEIHIYYPQFQGPAELLEELSRQPDKGVIRGNDGRYYLKQIEGNRPTAIVIQPGELPFWEFDMTRTTTFMAGEVKGVLSFGKDLVVGTRDLADLLLSAEFHKMGYGYTFVFGTDAERRWLKQKTVDIADQASDTMLEVASLGQAIQGQHEEIVLAAIALDWATLKKKSRTLSVAMSIGVEAVESAYTEYMSSSDAEMGKMTGRALAEVASLFAFYAKAGQANQVTKAEFITALKERPFFKNNPRLASRLQELDPLLAKLADGPGPGDLCFAAGTLVHTERGLKAIETIQVGDRVLARDETSGEQSYKPVLAVFTTRPRAFFRLDYQVMAATTEAAASLGTLRVTHVHPFFVVGKHAFVCVEDLDIGDEFLLADGRKAKMTGLEPELSPFNKPFIAYNFTVADFHTYFVGPEGLWVHNSLPKANFKKTTCQESSDLFWGVFERLTTKQGKTPQQALRQLLDDWADAPVEAKNLFIEKALTQMGQESQALAARAETIQNAYDHFIPKKLRTTAVLKAVDDSETIRFFVASSEPALVPLQKAILNGNEIPVAAAVGHAEGKAIAEALRRGFTPLEISVSRDICEECYLIIMSNNSLIPVTKLRLPKPK